MAVGISPGELRELTDDELIEQAARIQGRAVQLALPDGDRSAQQQPSAPPGAAGNRTDLHRAT